MMTLANDICGSLAAALGPGLLSVYQTGTYGTDRQIPTSDIDLVLVTDDDLDNARLAEALQVRKCYEESTGVDIGILPRSLSDILRRGMAIKHCAIHLYGRDIRGEIAEQPIGDRIAQLTGAAVMFSERAHGTDRLHYDLLIPPDPDDEYLGFLKPDDGLPLKALSNFSFHASARLAASERVFVLDKHEMPQTYQSVFDDWTVGFVMSLYVKVRNTWHYQMPKSPDGCDDLRRICQQVCSFERAVFSKLAQQADAADVLARATDL